MPKPMDLKFFRFRNAFGEIMACVHVVNPGDGYHMEVGFSCCNPMDLNLSRRMRLFKHYKASSGRMLRRMVIIPLPWDFMNVDAIASKVIKQKLIEYIKDYKIHNLGLKSYNGCKTPSFHTWMSKFVECISDSRLSMQIGANCSVTPLPKWLEVDSTYYERLL